MFTLLPILIFLATKIPSIIEDVRSIFTDATGEEKMGHAVDLAKTALAGVISISTGGQLETLQKLEALTPHIQAMIQTTYDMGKQVQAIVDDWSQGSFNQQRYNPQG